MAMHPTVEKHLDEIRALAASYGVEKLEIFGSVMTPEFDPERSDVDFIVHYPPGYEFGSFGKRLFDLEDSLAELLGRSTDVVMTSALKKDSFRRNAELTRTVIYESSSMVPGTSGHPDPLPVHR